MMEACRHLSQGQSDRNGESEEDIKVRDAKLALTFVLNEFDIMSLTVAITLTFSAAYVPGPMKNL